MRSKALLFLAIGPTFLAASLEALEVTPGALAFPWRPGRASKGYFIVVNDGAAPVSVRAEVSPLFGFDAGEKGKISVSPRRFDLAPGARRRVKVRVSSTRTLPREKAVQVAFTAQDPASPRLLVRLSQAVYLVSGREIPEARIESFLAKEDSPGVWSFQAVVSNPGSVHWMSRAVFAIVGPDGTVRERHSAPDLNVVFPGRKTSHTLSWTPSGPPDPGSSASVNLFYRPPFGETRKIENVVPLAP